MFKNNCYAISVTQWSIFILKSFYQIPVDMVKKLGTFKWCTLTKACEKNCVSDFESKTSRYDALGEFLYDPYSCKEDKDFCSAEETCSNELKCPTSITKAIDKW